MKTIYPATYVRKSKSEAASSLIQKYVQPEIGPTAARRRFEPKNIIGPDEYLFRCSLLRHAAYALLPLHGTPMFSACGAAIPEMVAFHVLAPSSHPRVKWMGWSPPWTWGCVCKVLRKLSLPPCPS